MPIPATNLPRLLKIAAIAAAFLAILAIAAAQAAELIYVHEAGCPYCRRWDQSVGPVFDRSEEAKRAPLRRIEKSQVAASGLALARPVIYTPTFVLVEDKRELGRLEGFVGEDFFWGMLGKLLARLPEPAAAGAKAP